jgi:hypothetical protein
LPVAQAISLARQTAAALAAAHDKGIVHRDLKPDNLFLISDPGSGGPERLKVLDFGIAKLRGELGGGSVKTNAGSILGTPPYMSPEQCRGINDEIDQRTDIYSLGIILFEMVCGRPPFQSDGYGDLVIMHLLHAPPAPRSLNPEVPPRLEAVILQALAKDPAHRFPTMRAFSAALAEAGNNAGANDAAPNAGALGPSHTTLSSVTGQMAVATEPGPRQRRRISALIVGAVAALAVVVIGGLRSRRDPAPALPGAAAPPLGQRVTAAPATRVVPVTPEPLPATPTPTLPSTLPPTPTEPTTAIGRTEGAGPARAAAGGVVAPAVEAPHAPGPRRSAAKRAAKRGPARPEGAPPSPAPSTEPRSAEPSAATPAPAPAAPLKVKRPAEKW